MPSMGRSFFTGALNVSFVSFGVLLMHVLAAENYWCIRAAAIRRMRLISRDTHGARDAWAAMVGAISTACIGLGESDFHCRLPCTVAPVGTQADLKLQACQASERVAGLMPRKQFHQDLFLGL